MAHPRCGHLSTWAPLCWEQRVILDRTNSVVQNMRWVSPELYSHSVTLKGQCLHGTDRSCCLGIYWVVTMGPNGHVAHISGGHFHLGYSLGTGGFCCLVTITANLPLLKARWAHSVFHYYDGLAAIFVPSIGLVGVLAQIEALLNSPSRP